LYFFCIAQRNFFIPRELTTGVKKNNNNNSCVYFCCISRPPVVAPSTSLYKFHRVEAFVSSGGGGGSPAAKLSPSAAKLSPKVPPSVYADETVFEPVAAAAPRPMQVCHS